MAGLVSHGLVLGCGGAGLAGGVMTDLCLLFLAFFVAGYGLGCGVAYLVWIGGRR